MEYIRPRSAKPPESAEPKPVEPAPSGPEKPPKSRFNGEALRSAVSTILLFVSAFVIALLLNAFVIQSYQVDGQSMEPTLHNDDRLIVYKLPRTVARVTGHAYTPHRGDIIIFNQAGLPGFIGEKQLIKRVIGLPGERLVVAGGHITIYNQAHPNGFDPDTSSGYHIAAPSTVGNVDVRLSNNELFVCGDNRNNSEDSRYFGPIKQNQIVAKLVFRILPLNQAKSF